MQIEPADRIIARIAEAHRVHTDGVLAFDGDGTLWSGDIGEDFFHALLARGDFRAAAVEQMRADAREFALSDHGDGPQLAHRLYGEYMAGRFPEERICELMTWCCAEWTRGEVRRFAAGVLEAGALGARVHREALRIVDWARGAGLDVFLVSASPRAIVEEAARALGIARERVVAATPVWQPPSAAGAPADGDRMAAKVERPIPYGPGKVENLRARVGARPLYAAFGDNAFDVALLNEAFIPVAVRPKPRLRDRAHEVHDIVEIAHES